MKPNGVAIASAAVLAFTAPAWAGPPHVLALQVVRPPSSAAVYAVSPQLDGATRRALTEALGKAGLRTAPVESPHGYLVTVQAVARAICSAGCSSLLGHDIGPLADNYRHEAVVLAVATTGERADPRSPVAWFTRLQSDGLSNRTDDYLPALMRYGARAYGRDTAPEAPPKLSAPLPLILPDPT